jgi:hypothetical protein
MNYLDLLLGSIARQPGKSRPRRCPGCANGDRGNVTGIKVPSITRISWPGTFTTQGGTNFDVTADVTQGNPSPEGSFGITGTVTFGQTCVHSGTITPGAFPTHSFIIGTFVSLEIETDNGTLVFRGTWSQASGSVSGDYTLSGGTCDQTGTGFLVSVWDY